VEEVMRERLNGSPREGSDSLPDSTQAAQQDVRAIAIGLEAEFAAQLAQPEDSLGRPTFHEEEEN
jgi:hypothetical protein